MKKYIVICPHFCMDEVRALESGAFVELRHIPPAGAGPLDGLTFAVKDLIDLAGRRTGGGHPRWRDTHPPALANAVVVDLLLAAGAACVGVTVTDELAASFAGENPFFGNPRNPAAPGHTPGGSSCGSASAVAHDLCDFALGTDTGGSIRVPASNCGVLGWRPSWGAVPTAGVNPLSPSYDTVGLLARRAHVLERAARVLLGDAGPTPRPDLPLVDPTGPVPLRQILRLVDAFAWVEPAVREALKGGVDALRALVPVRDVSLRALTGLDLPLTTWEAVFGCIETAEICAALGPWLASARPALGPVVARNLANLEGVDAALLERCWRLRRWFARALGAALPAGTLLAMPTATSPAPESGRLEDPAFSRTYAPAVLALCCLAGHAGLPQISLPMGSAGGLPVGLSLLAGTGQDAALLATAVRLEANGHLALGR